MSQESRLCVWIDLFCPFPTNLSPAQTGTLPDSMDSEIGDTHFVIFLRLRSDSLGVFSLRTRHCVTILSALSLWHRASWKSNEGREKTDISYLCTHKPNFRGQLKWISFMYSCARALSLSRTHITDYIRVRSESREFLTPPLSLF